MFIGFLLFVIGGNPAWAVDINIDPSLATAGAISPGMVISRDLNSNRGWSVKPSVGYFTGSTTVDSFGATTTSSGYGGTLLAQYSFNEHLGVIFSGMGYKGSGTFTPGPTEPEGLGASSGSVSVSGWELGTTLVLDPFSGSGFRMPFFIGVNYEKISSSTPTSAEITSMSLNSPGYTFGFSPRFNVAFLRVEPFLVTTTSFKNGNVTCSTQIIGGACGAIPIQMLPVTGVNLYYQPWKLSFYFNVSTFLLGTGIAFYSFGPQLTF